MGGVLLTKYYHIVSQLVGLLSSPNKQGMPCLQPRHVPYSQSYKLTCSCAWYATGRGGCGWGAVRAEHKLQGENPAVLREGPVQPCLPPRQRKVAGRRRRRVRLDDDSAGEEDDDESQSSPKHQQNTHKTKNKKLSLVDGGGVSVHLDDDSVDVENTGKSQSVTSVPAETHCI